MELKSAVLVFSSILAFQAHDFSQEINKSGKPNFSGTWVLDKDRSDLSSSPNMGHHRSSGGRMGSSGTGIPGMGIPGMGGPGMRGPRMGGGMGGPGMGGPGMGGPGMGGPDMGGGTPADSGEVNRPRNSRIPESLVIEHDDPRLVIRNKIKSENDEQVEELKYTTDGKSNANEDPQGNTMQSKTHWKGDQLITKSSLETPRGKMEVTEVRSLSPDGKTMTIEVKTSAGQGEWSHKLVYNRESTTSSL